MASLSQEQLKVLEQTRQRLVQLTQSLGSLVNSINQSNPLPAWSSLQSQASIISNNLVTISQLLNEHNDLLSSLVAYPTPTFPGKTESAMLNQLMRTKLEPRVEDWVSYGRMVGNATVQQDQAGNMDNTAAITTANGESEDKSVGLLSGKELEELWHWAPVEANMEARRRNWGGDYTLEEKQGGIRNVVTGLRRKLNENVVVGEQGEEEEDEEDEDEDEAEQNGGRGDDMEIVGVHMKPGMAGVEFDISREANRVPTKALSHALPLDDTFRYMMTGATPRSR